MKTQRHLTRARGSLVARSSPRLLNTLLQRGVGWTDGGANRFNGLKGNCKTVETVQRECPLQSTPLKRGVKENQHSRTVGFTLLELLVVISIIGLIAALAMPVMNNFKPNYTANATRTLLDELARARQLAISQRTTVYMVFVPTNFVADVAYAGLPQAEKNKAARLLDKQLIGYAFVSLRSMGDQPGRPTVRYLSEWKALPEGAFIAVNKFAPNNQYLTIYTNGLPAFQVAGFNKTSWVPFPSAEAAPYKLNPVRQPYVTLPYIAFDYMGRLVAFDAFNRPVAARNEIIPLAKGSILFARDPTTKQPTAGLPKVTESPLGNSTNAYNLVSIDWLTGRARGIQQEVR